MRHGLLDVAGPRAPLACVRLRRAFLVLQRKPLTLLHTWHHASVLVWSWHQYVARSG
jgi:hypothetical protein